MINKAEENKNNDERGGGSAAVAAAKSATTVRKCFCSLLLLLLSSRHTRPSAPFLKREICTVRLDNSAIGGVFQSVYRGNTHTLMLFTKLVQRPMCPTVCSVSKIRKLPKTNENCVEQGSWSIQVTKLKL